MGTLMSALPLLVVHLLLLRSVTATEAAAAGPGGMHRLAGAARKGALEASAGSVAKVADRVAEMAAAERVAERVAESGHNATGAWWPPWCHSPWSPQVRACVCPSPVRWQS